MTNSEVVGYLQEHTSFSSLQKIAGIFHSALRTCTVLSSTLWGGACLTLFLWPIWNTGKRDVFQALLSQRKERQWDNPIKGRIKESLRGIEWLSQGLMGFLSSAPRETGYTADREKKRDAVCSLVSRVNSSRLSTFCPEQRDLSTHITTLTSVNKGTSVYI